MAELGSDDSDHRVGCQVGHCTSECDAHFARGALIDRISQNKGWGRCHWGRQMA